MWIIKNENKGIVISLGIKKKGLDQELEYKKWNWTQVWRVLRDIYNVLQIMSIYIKTNNSSP